MLIFAIALTLCPRSASSQAPFEIAAPPPDWSEALRDDILAFRDVIQSSHPGPVDQDNPWFAARLEQAVERGLARAAGADDYSDWRYGLAEFAASFNDGHVGIARLGRIEETWESRWPGFLTGLRLEAGVERHVVLFTGAEGTPPLGAVLVGCDGRPAAKLAEEVLAPVSGRWFLAARRLEWAHRLFLDSGNPYVARPDSCTFDVDGVSRTFVLVWRDAPDDDLAEAVARARPTHHRAETGLRRWSRGFWIGMGSFETDPNQPEGVRLEALVDQLEAEAQVVRSAPTVVFDVRGNTGGSTTWMMRAARALWGDEEVDARRPRSTAVDWRVSEGNIARMAGYFETFAGSPASLAFVREVHEGMSKAHQSGEPLWRQPLAQDPPPDPPARSLMHARVYVLTDGACASSCLEAVDLLSSLGAVRIGHPTSADTDYAEVRPYWLPGERAQIYLPMKVHRGRARRANQPWLPMCGWTGTMADTAGLEQWLGELDHAFETDAAWTAHLGCYSAARFGSADTLSPGSLQQGGGDRLKSTSQVNRTCPVHPWPRFGDSLPPLVERDEPGAEGEGPGAETDNRRARNSRSEAGVRRT